MSNCLIGLVLLAADVSSAFLVQPRLAVHQHGARVSLPTMQFGGGGDKEPKGLSRDSEPDQFFATNMDDMSDAEKLKSPVLLLG